MNTYELTAFTGCLLTALPVDDWQIFFSSISQAISNKNSLYHFHLVYSAWGSGNEILDYNNFKNLFINSSNFYSSLDASFHSEHFKNLIQQNVNYDSELITNNSIINTAEKLISAEDECKEVFNNLDSENQRVLTEMPNDFSWSRLLRSLLGSINWMIEHRLSVSIGIATFATLVTSWGLVRPAVSVWIGERLNGNNHHGGSVSIPEMQAGRDVFFAPVKIPTEIVTAPKIGTPSLPDNPGYFSDLPSFPDLGILTIFPSLELPIQIGVGTGSLIIIAVASKKIGLLKLLPFLWK